MTKLRSLVLCLFSSPALFAQTAGDPGILKTEIFRDKGLTLTFINQDPSLDPSLKKQLVGTFFKVYPVLAETYNPETLKEVTFFVDTAYDGVAEAGGGRVRFSSKWFHQKPKDIDVVTHEVMHIVQSYPDHAGPWWITEGIADYVRFAFGVDNAGGGWSLPDYKSEQRYDNSYRITARFLAWIEQTQKKGFVKTMDAAMRSKTYTEALWKDQTGKTIEELWKTYGANPSLTTKASR